MTLPFDPTGYPGDPPSGPINCGEAPQPPPPGTRPHVPDPNKNGKCRRCGFWHDLEQNLGEVIGEVKSGE